MDKCCIWMPYMYLCTSMILYLGFLAFRFVVIIFSLTKKFRLFLPFSPSPHGILYTKIIFCARLLHSGTRDTLLC
jgi:hypothetical protein